MANKYVDVVNGSDTTGDGSSGNPWQTITYAYTNASAGDWILLRDGVFTDVNTLNLTKNINFWGIGSEVWIDQEGVRNGFNEWDNLSRAHIFGNIKFRNPNANYGFLQVTRTNVPPAGWAYRAALYNCLFLGTGSNHALRAVSGAYSTNSGSFVAFNCHFENLAYAVANLGGSCGLWNCTARNIGTLGVGEDVWQYSGIAGGTGNNVNATTYPPPYRDPTNFDFSLDPGGTNADQYFGKGLQDADIGMPGGRCWFGHFEWSPDTRFCHGSSGNNEVVGGSYINDDVCYDPAFPSTTITSGVNDDLDFDEGSGELTATIAAGTYTSGADFAAAIQTAVNNVASDTHAVSWNTATHRIDWSSDGTALTLKIADGTNVATSAWEDMGFSLQVNKTGGTSYSGDYAITEGDGTDGTDVQIDASHSNNKLDFDEGAGELTATIADTDTKSMATVATNVETALEAAGTDTYTVSFDGDGKYSKKFKIVKDGGGTLTLKWSTGTNAANSVGKTIGFDTSADDSGATEYIGDLAVTAGPTTSGGTYKVIIDYSVEPDARKGRAMGPVLDKGNNGRPAWNKVSWSETDVTEEKRYITEDNSVGTVLTRAIEVRADEETFDQDAADSGLDHNFTSVDRDSEFDWEQRYFQVRVTLREVIP